MVDFQPRTIACFLAELLLLSLRFIPLFFFSTAVPLGPNGGRKKVGAPHVAFRSWFMRHGVRHFCRLTMSDPAVNTHRQGGFGQNGGRHVPNFVSQGARRVWVAPAPPLSAIAGPRPPALACSSPLVQYPPSRQMRPACAAQQPPPSLP